GLEGLVCGLLFKKTMKTFPPVVKRLLSALAGGLICWIGYFLTDLILFGIEIALLTLALTPIQVGVSVVIALFASPKLFGFVGKNDDEETINQPNESKDDTKKD
ncbi:MAG: hypothetical protein IJY70_06090, partial [Clostridia bacterium]|nr:hypothetical protein [Clostridia bacterium]